MELLHSVWQVGILALVAGVMIGVLAYRLLSPSVKQAGKIKSELDEARDELTSYKISVNQHFNKTSELVNDLTQNYVKVYQHLAEGAQVLGDSKTFNNLLEQNQGRLSISVDDQKSAPGKAADDSIINAAAVAAATVETVDEHAEPFTDVAVGQAESASPADEVAKASVAESPGEPASPGDEVAEAAASEPPGMPDSPDETMEPVVNVDALEEAIENADVDSRANAESALPEGEEKTEVRATTH